MARRVRVDRGFESRLDEFEQKIFLLKIVYEKYFNGFEKIEPERDRDKLRRLVYDLVEDCPNNTAQAHRLTALKARFSSYELYWRRNLVMIERGTHPKFKFRANLKDRERAAMEDAFKREEAVQRRQDRKRREDRAYHALYDSYMEARRQCGQSKAIPFDSVKSALSRQVSSIKEKTGCRTVKFRIAVEDGKAKVKAVPIR